MKKSCRYEDKVVHKLHNMEKAIAVPMKNRMFSGKYAMSIISVLQEFKSVCNVCIIHEGGTLLFKQYFTGPIKPAAKAQVLLGNSASFYHEGALKSYYTIVQFLLKRCATDISIAELDADLRNL